MNIAKQDSLARKIVLTVVTGLFANLAADGWKQHETAPDCMVRGPIKPRDQTASRHSCVVPDILEEHVGADLDAQCARCIRELLAMIVESNAAGVQHVHVQPMVDVGGRSFGLTLYFIYYQALE